ncbi:hypothetical protein PRZ48_003398 [Zasmidium cellare]|uniref:SnoaL-like domain-containing protein n=1 Tax=Zasmidium cellare TaxID=395010 RepID=A0ABR0EVZ1_ZASCE|nr:hypothetical protein PRZ48_003398 [Zasmidium cellare]
MSASFTGLAAVGGDPLGKPSGAMNITTYLDGLARLCEFFPDFRVTPISINPEASTRKRASCLLSMEYSGMGEGIVRPCVATLDFRLVEGEGWVCTKMESFEGLLGDGFEFPGGAI